MAEREEWIEPEITCHEPLLDVTGQKYADMMPTPGPTPQPTPG
jgi:hypothetical protein